MSDQTDDEIVFQKLKQGNMTIYNLLDYWYIKYNIQKWQLDFVKDYIRSLEGKNE